MKTLISILFCIASFASNGQYKGYHYSKDSISLEIDSIVYLNLLSEAGSIRWMEIGQSKPLNQVKIINDSIGFFENLGSLYIQTKCPLKISNALSKLKNLKEVAIAANIIYPARLSFANSRKGLQHLKIINYSRQFILPENINEYTSLKTLLIDEPCNKVNKDKIIAFFYQLNNLNLESFKFTLPGISKTQKNSLNKELAKDNLKYKVS